MNQNEVKYDMNYLESKLNCIERKINTTKTALDVAKSCVFHKDSIPILEDDLDKYYREFINVKTLYNKLIKTNNYTEPFF